MHLRFGSFNKRLMRQSLLIALTLLVALWSCSENKTDKIEEVIKENRIFDNANLLTPIQEDSIFYLIKDLDTSIGSQIAVLTIDTLNGIPMNDYSIMEADKLGLGRKEQNDGLLITVSLKDKAIRIEVGVGLENIIKDEVAARIISMAMVPKFKEDKFGPGIYDAVYNIKSLIETNKELVGKMPQDIK